MSDIHKHQCEACKHVWEHDRDAILERCEADGNDDYYETAHRCPVCHTGPYTFVFDPRESEHEKFVRMAALLTIVALFTEKDNDPLGLDLYRPIVSVHR